MRKFPLIAMVALLAIAELATKGGDAPATSPTSTPSQEPYRYSSLKDASDAELFRFMADGKSEIDREFEAEIKTHLPDDFWTADAKTAALAFVEANRKPEHRAAYTLALHSAEGGEPPAHCTLTLANFSSRDYNMVDSHYFVRVDPGESYLAYTQSWSGGEAFYNAVHDQPAFNFRLCSLSYEDARKIADVIWWLHRIESKRTQTDSTFTSSSLISTADGRGKLTFRSESSPLIEVGASRWAGYLAEHWSEGYEPEVFLNFAAYLIQSALPEHLGAEWSKFEPKHPPEFDFGRNYTPVYEEEERKRLCDLAFRFLDWFTLDQKKISFAIVADAAWLSGRFGISNAGDRLRAIEKALPPAGPKRRSGREVLSELDKLPHEWDVRDEKERKRIEQQRSALDAELDWHLYDRGVNNPDHVREAIAITLRRFALANNAAKLQASALSKSIGREWAMQRLGELDKKRYAEVLEALTTQADAKLARQFFDELIKVDVKRARALAGRLTSAKRDTLAIPAWLVLGDVEELPDENTRAARISEILLDPKTIWEDQKRAIELLVPKDKPLRYPGREIDEALVKFLERERKATDSNFATGDACRALVRRGRTDLFDRIAAQFSAKTDPIFSDDVLGALANLAQADPARLDPRLAEIVRPHLAATNHRMTEIFWTIWAADLRELQSDLQRLATQNVEEIEDRKANSSGGDVTPVTGRFHFARKIVSLWSEPDPLARARLLVAFAVANSNSFVQDDWPERVARMKAEMLRASDDLSPEAKLKLTTILDRVDANPALDNGERLDDEIRHKITAFAREALRL